MPALAWAGVVIVWLAACWLGLVFVAMPLTLAAIALGLAVGAVVAAAGFVRIYRGMEDERGLARPAAITRRAVHAPYPQWDLGWPNYLSRQVERDIAVATVWPRRIVNSWWVSAAEWTGEYVAVIVIAAPFALPPLGFLVAATVGVYGAAVAYGGAVEIATAGPRLVRLAMIGAVRAGDAAVRWRYGAAATCPSCHWVSRLPAYQCNGAGCGIIHRDVRPGRLGVLSRRCSCGARLPTTVLRASRELTAVCIACGDPLHRGAGATADTRIAISGGRAVGKTTMLMEATAAMTTAAGESPALWEAADQSARAWLASAQEFLAGFSEHEPPPASGPLTLRACTEPQRYVHISEVADSDTRVPGPLSTTRRHVLVLDATMISSAAAALTIRGIELPYHLLVARLKGLGARPSRCSLAVVVSHADLLAGCGVVPESRSPDGSSQWLRDWLCETGLRSLVELAEHDFAEVRYFLAGRDIKSMDPVAAFAWLLSRNLKGPGRP